MSYRIERGVAYLDYDGEWLTADMVDLHRRVAADPAFRPDMAKVIRFRRMAASLTVEELADASRTLKALHAGQRTARRTAFVSDDRAMEQIARLWGDVYGIGSKDSMIDVRYFTDPDEAEAWARE